MKNTKKKGFTIVELVIVIAVIGILSAILIPTFSNLVKNANEAKLQADLRNAYTAYVDAQAENVATSGLLGIEEVVFEKDGDYYVYNPETGKYAEGAKLTEGKLNSKPVNAVVTPAEPAANEYYKVSTATFNGFTAYYLYTV